MDDEFSKAATEFVTRNFASIVRLGSQALKYLKNRDLNERLRTAYGAYLYRAAHHYGRTKSFFLRDAPTSIYDFYVPIHLTCRVDEKDKTLSEVTLDSITSVTNRAVIVAQAGAGKSMLLRHLLLHTIAASDRVPVFLELRNIEGGILDAIASSLESFGFDLGPEYVELGISRGHFVLILDGFDEVKQELRMTFSAQIEDLARRGPNCPIVVSSRPDDIFSGWDGFQEMKVEPLTLEEACEVVQKLPFDEGVKGKFLDDLQETLFQRHQSFLSNPLLLSIMALTYQENANIPSKVSLFYAQAYEALFLKHDARKGAFRRTHLTSLDIQDFARVFGAFCVQTYNKREFSFTYMEAIAYIKKSSANVLLDVDPGHFLQDCRQAVCLLVDDGTKIAFTHRSFQEYFVASYIHNADPITQRSLIQRFSGSLGQDNVMSLLWEINSSLVDRELLIVGLEKMFEEMRVTDQVEIQHYFRILEHELVEFEVTDRRSSRWAHAPREDAGPPWYALIEFACSRWQIQNDRTSSWDLWTTARDMQGGGEEGKRKFVVSELSSDSEIVMRLARSGGPMICSMDVLNDLLHAHTQVRARYARTEATLDELLD